MYNIFNKKLVHSKWAYYLNIRTKVAKLESKRKREFATAQQQFQLHLEIIITLKYLPLYY